jgi:N-carbamoyl-L-amino-acid hydrolase
VGELHVEPNSRNVIPGEVRFSIEFRHPDANVLDRLDALFQREAGLIAEAGGVQLALDRLFRIGAQPFDEGCVDLVRQAASRLGLPAREIVSGAGHDAVYVATRVPTAMIFTPCEGGLSHNEAESISPEDAADGCQTLFESVVVRANRPV